MFTREAIQVCDNLYPNLAIDSDTDTDSDFTDDDFRPIPIVLGNF